MGHDERGDGGLDAEAFEAIVVEHAQALHAFARTLMPDIHAAEALTQQAFILAFDRRQTFDGASTSWEWLRRIMLELAAGQGDAGTRSHR